MSNLVKVGMADLKAIKYPGILTTLGLGSCIGICIYDPSSKIAGMAHIMLPSSKDIRNNSNIAKFADTAIDQLLDEMQKLGASKSRMIAKIAGGAQMFSSLSSNETLKVGQKNAISVREHLHEHRIPLRGDDTGGNYGRTIEFDASDGSLVIKTIGHGMKTI